MTTRTTIVAHNDIIVKNIDTRLKMRYNCAELRVDYISVK